MSQEVERQIFKCCYSGCEETTHKDIELLDRGWIAYKMQGSWNGTTYRVLCPKHAQYYIESNPKPISAWEQFKQYEQAIKDGKTVQTLKAPEQEHKKEVKQIKEHCIDI